MIIDKWPTFEHQGQSYLLAHLNDLEITFVQGATASQPERSYSFVVSFGLHCFTRGANPRNDENLSDFSSFHYSDHRETRIFCFERYRQSFLLPRIAKEISQRKCFNTGKGNFFTIEIVDLEGISREYEVYFKVSRESRGKLRLHIISAYIRDNAHGSAQPQKKKISFFVIAHNIQSGKSIK
uniref:hypothetical protein n=1 Tax=Erwinia piriflorinigrans TaxID=665097 RepID=UPI0015950D1D|nr:hypothetical protein [Erwinia piriflorinigrans]